MKLNWIGYWMQEDGYGRFNTRLVRALQQAGVDVRAVHIGELERPAWMLDQLAIDWNQLTITCTPPYMVTPVPGRHWLYTMTEGSVLPDGWAEAIHAANLERVLVPCQHNADAFANSGVNVPIHVVHGGTNPDEFPLTQREPAGIPWVPYTFLTFADRNERKGWHEVWEAFYLAFGGKTTGTMDVRLTIKYRPDDNNVTTVMAAGGELDPRIIYHGEDVAAMRDLYAQADCLVLPSRSEGWGMIHREAAMMGLPVITQAYSGMDDGHTRQWALVVERGQMQPIPKERSTSLGEWRVVDKQELAATMRRCYEQPHAAALFGRKAARWLRQHQTWRHSADVLLALVREREPLATGGYEYAV